jgi:hypothetical protein
MTASIARRRFVSFAAFTLGFGLLVASQPVVAQGQPTTGPDVTVNRLNDIFSYGNSGGLLGYMVGTTSCNIGDEPVNWCDGGSCGGVLTSKQHPVIGEGLYRLKNGRLDQVGMSWLKHGFVSTNSLEAACKQGSNCTAPPLGGNQLGIGCTDTYWATLNGGRPMGMRSEVNATLGDLIFDYTSVPSGPEYEQRIKVAQADVDPALNPGALYWVEGQYVSDNDAAAGNGLNNASYRPVSVAVGTFALSLQGTLVRERSAIHAWVAADPAVELFNVDISGPVVERFEVARKVTAVDGDTWHYEYAIRNMNSDRSARAFAVDFPGSPAIASPGFKDVDHHSGEPYSTTDWTVAVDGGNGTVSWATETFAANANANALRWATLFNFWFDADAPPAAAVHTLELFKPGDPASVTFRISLFSDGFESHNLTAWSVSVP